MATRRLLGLRVLDFFQSSMQVVWRLLFLFIFAFMPASAGVAVRGKDVGKAPSAAKRPNIILITLDTTRADRMGFLGSTRGLTPSLDALARQSVIFTRAYAQVPLTTPSHAALLTGTYPQFSHIKDLGTQLGKDLPYLPDLLHQHGYQTAAFIGAQILDPAGTAPGFERGFDLYDADFHQRKPGEDRYKSIERRAEDVANRAMGWLSRHQQGPFFIWLHFYDPHDPYDPPEPFRSHFASAPYDGEIAYTDSIVGSLMDVLDRHGLFQECVIAVAADHGEAFGEHGEERHGMFLYDETIHVPLLLKLPEGRYHGKRVEERVALADVAPSLLEAAGIPIPAAMQARSLFPLVGAAKSAGVGKANSPARPIYSETNYAHRTFGWAELQSWRTGKYMYVQAPKRELYDQSSDPGARHNLAVGSKAVADTLEAQLTGFLQKTSSGPIVQGELDPAQVEKLRALGYLASDSTEENNGKRAAIDPKDKIEIANRFHRAIADREEDRYDEAIAELRAIVAVEPELGSAYLELGGALAQEQKYQEALNALRMATVKTPNSGMAHSALGSLLIKTGQWDAALPEMQAAVVCTPGSSLMHFDLAAVQTHLKHFPEAIEEYESALKIDPDYFEASMFYGRFLLQTGHPDAALPKLLHAARINPDSAEVHAFLADAYRQLGQTENAERERTKAAELKAEPPQ
jgi:arylsulfatase A-like enzyme/Flp pilus assembly protein TadD